MTDTFDWVLWTIPILIVFLFGYLLYSEFTIATEMKEACEKFGGEYSTLDDKRVCFKQGKVYPFIEINGRYELYVRGGDNHD